MAIKRIGSLDGAGEVTRNDILMTNSEALVDGKAYVITTGRITAAAATVKPQLISRTAHAAEAASSKYREFVVVRDDDVFEAEYTGTTPVVGIKIYRLTTDLLKVDGSQTSGGKVEVLTVDTAKTKCTFKFND